MVGLEVHALAGGGGRPRGVYVKRRIAGRAVRASRGWGTNRNNDMGSRRRRMAKVKTPSGVPVWVAGSVVSHFRVFRAAAWVLNGYGVRS